MNNYLLKWVPNFGINKGKEVTQWFQFGDPLIDYLINECNAEIIDEI